MMLSTIFQENLIENHNFAEKPFLKWRFKMTENDG